MITSISLIAILLMFMCTIAYCSYLQNENIRDMNRRLNILAKDYELLEADFQLQEQAFNNIMKSMQQIEE